MSIKSKFLIIISVIHIFTFCNTHNSKNYITDERQPWCINQMQQKMQQVLSTTMLIKMDQHSLIMQERDALFFFPGE